MRLPDHILRQARAHDEKWEVLLPRFPVNQKLPERDGDIALLEELADKIFSALDAGARPSVRVKSRVVVAIDKLRRRFQSGDADVCLAPWPADEAGELIAAWRESTREAA